MQATVTHGYSTRYNYPYLKKAATSSQIHKMYLILKEYVRTQKEVDAKLWKTGIYSGCYILIANIYIYISILA